MACKLRSSQRGQSVKAYQAFARPTCFRSSKQQQVSSRSVRLQVSKDWNTLIRYVFLTRNLINGTLVVRLLESRILELRKFSPGAQAVIFFAKGAPPEYDSDLIEFRATGRWPAIVWHLVNPFILRNWARQEVGMRTLILRRGVLPNPLIGLVFSGKKFLLLTEHHTKRLDEFASLWNLPAWLVRPLFWLDSVAIDNKLAGKICVTGEIAESENFPGKVLVVANPIMGELVRHRPQPMFDGHHLRVAMPLSGTYPWHGVDRLIKSVVEWANTSPELKVD